MNIKNFALIIGAAKCGTTSLFNYLSEHPEISACCYKEPHFFSKKDNFAKGYTYYQSLFNWNTSTHKVALEATPGYTRVTNNNLSNAAENIAQFISTTNTNFKFIYIVRDPIERIESHYTHLEAWRQEPDKQPLKVGLDKEIIDVSKYAMQIEEYYKRFDSSDILIINFQDFKNDSREVLKKVCLFLEIDENYNFQGAQIVHNSNKQRTKIDLPLIYQLKSNKTIKYIANQILPNSTKQKLRKLLGSKISNFVKMSPHHKEIIVNELQTDIAKLKTKYGVNTDTWNI